MNEDKKNVQVTLVVLFGFMSLGLGFVVLGWHCYTWLRSGYWPSFTIWEMMRPIDQKSIIEIEWAGIRRIAFYLLADAQIYAELMMLAPLSAVAVFCMVKEG